MDADSPVGVPGPGSVVGVTHKACIPGLSPDTSKRLFCSTMAYTGPPGQDLQELFDVCLHSPLTPTFLPQSIAVALRCACGQPIVRLETPTDNVQLVPAYNQIHLRAKHLKWWRSHVAPPHPVPLLYLATIPTGSATTTTTNQLGPFGTQPRDQHAADPTWRRTNYHQQPHRASRAEETKEPVPPYHQITQSHDRPLGETAYRTLSRKGGLGEGVAQAGPLVTRTSGTVSTWPGNTDWDWRLGHVATAGGQGDGGGRPPRPQSALAILRRGGGGGQIG